MMTMTQIAAPDAANGKRRHSERPYASAFKKRKTNSPYFHEPKITSADLQDETDSASVADSAHSSSGDDEDSEALSGASTPATPPLPSANPTYKPSARPLKYHCTYADCNKVYSRPSRLEEHIRSHTNERPFKCAYQHCEKAFLRQGHLDHHVKSAHTRERNYVCDWQGCDKRFLTAQRLRNHGQTHINKNRYRCTEYPPCDKTFRKHGTLKSHIDADHLNKKPFPCTETDRVTGEPCAAAFDRAFGLRTHVAKCHQAGKKFWCSICNSRQSAQDNSDATRAQVASPLVGFSTYIELQNHTRTCHLPRCTHCRTLCSSQADLNNHVETHHSDKTLQDRQTHICWYPGCGKGFVKKSNLKTHYRSSHEKCKPFVCGETDISSASGLENWDGSNACNRGFTAKASLESHVRKFHLHNAAATTASSSSHDGGHNASRHVYKNKKNNSNNTTSQPKTDALTYRQKPSTASRLTGAGYEEESGRSIPCPVDGCQYRFKRDADLRQHVRSTHGLPHDSEHGEGESVAEARAESEALAGGKFWIGGLDEDQGDDDDYVGDARGLQAGVYGNTTASDHNMNEENDENEDEDEEDEDEDEDDEERQLMRDLASVAWARQRQDDDDEMFIDEDDDELIDPELLEIEDI